MEEKSSLGDSLLQPKQPQRKWHGKSQCGTRLKTPAPKTTRPPVTQLSEPTLGTTLGCQSQVAHRKGKVGGLHVLVTNQSSSGRGSQWEIKLNTLNFPGGEGIYLGMLGFLSKSWHLRCCHLGSRFRNVRWWTFLSFLRCLSFSSNRFNTSKS